MSSSVSDSVSGSSSSAADALISSSMSALLALTSSSSPSPASRLLLSSSSTALTTNSPLTSPFSTSSSSSSSWNASYHVLLGAYLLFLFTSLALIYTFFRQRADRFMKPRSATISVFLSLSTIVWVTFHVLWRLLGSLAPCLLILVPIFMLSNAILLSANTFVALYLIRVQLSLNSFHHHFHSLSAVVGTTATPKLSAWWAAGAANFSPSLSPSSSPTGSSPSSSSSSLSASPLTSPLLPTQSATASPFFSPLRRALRLSQSAATLPSTPQPPGTNGLLQPPPPHRRSLPHPSPTLSPQLTGIAAVAAAPASTPPPRSRSGAVTSLPQPCELPSTPLPPPADARFLKYKRFLNLAACAPLIMLAFILLCILTLLVSIADASTSSCDSYLLHPLFLAHVVTSLLHAVTFYLLYRMLNVHPRDTFSVRTQIDLLACLCAPLYFATVLVHSFSSNYSSVPLDAFVFLLFGSSVVFTMVVFPVHVQRRTAERICALQLEEHPPLKMLLGSTDSYMSFLLFLHASFDAPSLFFYHALQSYYALVFSSSSIVHLPLRNQFIERIKKPKKKRTASAFTFNVLTSHPTTGAPVSAIDVLACRVGEIYERYLSRSTGESLPLTEKTMVKLRTGIKEIADALRPNDKSTRNISRRADSKGGAAAAIAGGGGAADGSGGGAAGHSSSSSSSSSSAVVSGSASTTARPAGDSTLHTSAVQLTPRNSTLLQQASTSDLIAHNASFSPDNLAMSSSALNGGALDRTNTTDLNVTVGGNGGGGGGNGDEHPIPPGLDTPRRLTLPPPSAANDPTSAKAQMKIVMSLADIFVGVEKEIFEHLVTDMYPMFLLSPYYRSLPHEVARMSISRGSTNFVADVPARFTLSGIAHRSLRVFAALAMSIGRWAGSDEASASATSSSSSSSLSASSASSATTSSTLRLTVDATAAHPNGSNAGLVIMESTHAVSSSGALETVALLNCTEPSSNGAPTGTGNGVTGASASANGSTTTAATATTMTASTSSPFGAAASSALPALALPPTAYAHLGLHATAGRRLSVTMGVGTPPSAVRTPLALLHSHAGGTSPMPTDLRRSVIQRSSLHAGNHASATANAVVERVLSSIAMAAAAAAAMASSTNALTTGSTAPVVSSDDDALVESSVRSADQVSAFGTSSDHLKVNGANGESKTSATDASAAAEQSPLLLRTTSPPAQFHLRAASPPRAMSPPLVNGGSGVGNGGGGGGSLSPPRMSSPSMVPASSILHTIRMPLAQQQQQQQQQQESITSLSPPFVPMSTNGAPAPPLLFNGGANANATSVTSPPQGPGRQLDPSARGGDRPSDSFLIDIHGPTHGLRSQRASTSSNGVAGSVDAAARPSSAATAATSDGGLLSASNSRNGRYGSTGADGEDDDDADLDADPDADICHPAIASARQPRRRVSLSPSGMSSSGLRRISAGAGANGAGLFSPSSGSRSVSSSNGLNGLDVHSGAMLRSPKSLSPTSATARQAALLEQQQAQLEQQADSPARVAELHALLDRVAEPASHAQHHAPQRSVGTKTDVASVPSMASASATPSSASAGGQAKVAASHARSPSDTVAQLPKLRSSSSSSSSSTAHASPALPVDGAPPASPPPLPPNSSLLSRSPSGSTLSGPQSAPTANGTMARLPRIVTSSSRLAPLPNLPRPEALTLYDAASSSSSSSSSSSPLLSAQLSPHHGSNGASSSSDAPNKKLTPSSSSASSTSSSSSTAASTANRAATPPGSASVGPRLPLSRTQSSGGAAGAATATAAATTVATTATTMATTATTMATTSTSSALPPSMPRTRSPVSPTPPSPGAIDTLPPHIVSFDPTPSISWSSSSLSSSSSSSLSSSTAVTSSPAGARMLRSRGVPSVSIGAGPESPLSTNRPEGFGLELGSPESTSHQILLLPAAGLLESAALAATAPNLVAPMRRASKRYVPDPHYALAIHEQRSDGVVDGDDDETDGVRATADSGASSDDEEDGVGVSTGPSLHYQQPPPSSLSSSSSSSLVTTSATAEQSGAAIDHVAGVNGITCWPKPLSTPHHNVAVPAGLTSSVLGGSRPTTGRSPSLGPSTASSMSAGSSTSTGAGNGSVLSYTTISTTGTTTTLATGPTASTGAGTSSGASSAAVSPAIMMMTMPTTSPGPSSVVIVGRRSLSKNASTTTITSSGSISSNSNGNAVTTADSSLPLASATNEPSTTTTISPFVQAGRSSLRAHASPFAL